jgi:hypothetical protein
MTESTKKRTAVAVRVYRLVSRFFMPTITKQVIAFGEPTIIGCDAQCSKAWGINNRPRHQLSEDHDDYAFLADGELGEAPEDPGTYEGGHAKPTHPDERLNKWCFRECERCASARAGQPLKYPNLLVRLYNIPAHDPANDLDQTRGGQRSA